MPWSMRFPCATLCPPSGISGHDQFFATFDRFEALGNAHDGEWVDEIATRACAAERAIYRSHVHAVVLNAAKLGYQIGWSGDSAEDLKKTCDALLAGGLRDEIATDRQELDEVEADRAQREHCGEAATETRLFCEGALSVPGIARISPSAGLRADATWI